MATLSFKVGYNSKPTLNPPALLDGAGEPVDITGYSFRLIVKPFLSNEDGPLPDSRAWVNLAGTIVEATEGTYKFALTALETSHPAGTWPGEILIWSGATDEEPDHRISVDYEVEEAVDRT